MNLPSYFILPSATLAPLLQITLDHPHQPLSKVTIAFWKDTFGKNNNLCYPECLLPILSRLLKKGSLNAPKDGILMPKRAPYRNGQRKGSLDNVVLIQRSKQVVADEGFNELGHVNVEPQGMRSKRLGLLTKHSNIDKNHLNAAHQAKIPGDDSSWRSPKGNVVREVDSIMEMLRR